ncbi:MmcQ/YjbR family DNA-binding protein [Actibacterium sp. 188UL27-1]|uniref:MmcQ/YjbR family DNA-binding protein n=1 Tax=Actibacterium sp. 188UL27-1 TaxID=2786961 RepID=UPI00195A8471|nr:MmcQ/YjbR family DNA-binding protein [Actibacterium sp. 188UL27-1]MBM7067322.1 MmcQ/YjbR family DNA-binding protein [Actibacterium sp. 188UL27-1]
MDRDIANRTAAARPGATLEHPFGDDLDTWKVGGKIFAIVGAKGRGTTLKCANPDTAALLIDMGRAEPAPYLKRGGWVLIPWDRMEGEELAERVETSYQTVRATLTKKVRDAL